MTDHPAVKLKRGFRQLLDEATSQIVTIPVEDALDMIERDDVLFVDLRDVREIAREGKIPGAFHCPRGMLEFWIDPESPYHKPPLSSGKQLVFYCASAWRSALAAKAAQDMGVPAVAHLGGGFSAWLAADGDIELI